MNLRRLKELASKCNCTVRDDKTDHIITITADDGHSWEDGETGSMCEGYGSGAYVPEWRAEAISELHDRLLREPPDNVPFKYDD